MIANSAGTGDEKKWTPQQLRAIETTGRSLLVSAAAGSGKTAVLAERCAYLVCDAKPPCGVDELLVVTFTNASATEMRQRIESVLRKRLEVKADQRLARQLALIERAQISTLHGFCSRVLKQNFHLVGIDPNFKTLDQEESVLLRSEVARELFADRYAGAKAADFEKFVDHYGNGNDVPLLARVIRTYDLMASMIDPGAWANRAVNRIKTAQRVSLKDSDLGKELARLIVARCSNLRRRAIIASERLAGMPGLDGYAEYVNELLAVIQDWQDCFGNGDFDALATSVHGFEMPTLPAARGIDAEVREAGKKIVESVRKEMKEGSLSQICRFSTADWKDGLNRVAGPTKTYIDLALEFGKRYKAAKDELRAIDFSDLERFTLKILRDERVKDKLVPSDAARAYHARFAHVLVDEYQDINPVQDAILSLVSRECLHEDQPSLFGSKSNDIVQNLFCVGDVKQSIYRFRLADPDRFLKRDDRFRHGSKRNGEVIDLQANFRTREPLINVINGVFERLMSKESAEIAYDESHQLRAGFPYPDPQKDCFTGSPVELHCLPELPRSAQNQQHDAEADEMDRTQREAVVVANRIREMMGLHNCPRALVYDKDAKQIRPIQYRDMIILLRSMKVKADQFASQLRQAGVPVHSDSGTGFFESIEVRDILALLRLLDNQRQDVPMAAVLRSPLAKLPHADDCLATVRLAFRERYIPFHEAVVRYAQTGRDEIAASLKAFLKELAHWRELVHRRPLAEVLWTIYDTTGYLAFCAGLEDGEQRVANLIALHERARQFGTFQRQGLSRFMQFIRNLQDESDLGQSPVASEADDAVKIMSIHRAKGLEFPVVFLPDLGKKHNLVDADGMILVDREAHVGMQAVDEEKRIRYPSLPWVLAENRLTQKMLAEELRVLYVAMTRAREHLILVGTCRENDPESWEDWKRHTGPLPADMVLGGNTMLDWIGPAASCVEASRAGSFVITLHEEESIRAMAGQILRKRELPADKKGLAHLEHLSPAPASNEGANRIIERLTRPYAFEAFSKVPAARSVTSLTKTGRAAPGGQSASYRDIVPFDIELAAPRCVALERTPTAIEVGNATHLVLQYLDFTRAPDRNAIEMQLAEFTRRKLISPADHKMVDIEALIWLADTELGKLLREHHAKLRRELPVYFSTPAPIPQTSAAPLDCVMVRGRLDVVIPLPDGLLLADYKTDRVTADTVDARADFYRPQMQSYADAIAKIAGKPIKQTYLAFLGPRILKKI